MTGLAARLAGAFRAPGRPSLLDTASLAMFSIVGAPPLTWPSPPAGTEPAEVAADREAGASRVRPMRSNAAKVGA